MNKILEILVNETVPHPRNAINVPGYSVSISRESDKCEIKYFNNIEHIANWYHKRGEGADITLNTNAEDYQMFWDVYLDLTQHIHPDVIKTGDLEKKD